MAAAVRSALGAGAVLARLGAGAAMAEGEMASILAADLGQQQGAVRPDGRAGWCGPPGAGAYGRVGGRRLERIGGSMRTGASVAGGCTESQGKTDQR